MATGGSGFCPVCNQQRRIERATTNNVFHLLMTVLTLGLWALIWAFQGTSGETATWRCTTCGSPVATGLLQRPVGTAKVTHEERIAQGDEAATLAWLRQLDRLRREGKVSDEDFERMRSEALNG